MLGTYYKVDLLTRAFRECRPLQGDSHGLADHPYAAVLRMALRVRVCGGTELDLVPPLEVPGFQIECLSTMAEVERLNLELRSYPQLLPDDPHRLRALGALFWVGRVGGQLAALGASRRGAPMGHYFFPLMNNCVVLSHFATVPQFRGRGLYPALLVHILHQLAGTQIEYFVIECSDWNVGSQRGIERAGFRHIGYGKVTRRSRLSWHPLLPPATAPTRIQEASIQSTSCEAQHDVVPLQDCRAIGSERS